MRSTTRRAALALGLSGLAGSTLLSGCMRRQGSDEAVAPEITAMPLAGFLKERPEERRFGALTFRSGLVLSSSTSGFGGFSALWRDPAGSRLVAVSDHAQWLTAEVRYESGRLAGLGGARLAPILGKGGVPLRRGPDYDCESLAMANGTAFVGVERTHRIMRFDWASSGVRAEGRPIAVPSAMASLSGNGGIEALAVAPARHPLAGALVAIAEISPLGGAEPVPGWVLDGAAPFAFHVAKTDIYSVTDAAFLPGGELLLLERSFSPFRGAGCRIRRFARDAIRPGAVIEGEVILECDRAFEIDNMEGLAVHRDPASGETVLTLISDDNFMPFQRTLLLEFTLAA